MDLLHATYVTHEFAPHFHEGYAVGVIVRGEYSYRYQGSTHHIGKGQIVIINPGEVHTGKAVTDRGWTYRMFYPDIAFLRDIIGETKCEEISFPETVIDDRETAAALLSAHTACETEESLEYEVQLQDAFCRLVRRYGKPVRKDFPSLPASLLPVKRTIEYMKENCHRPLTLKDLANVSGLSIYHFIRVFGDQMGIPPHTYLMNLRTRFASKLILEGRSLTEAAAEAGFTDQSHMNRWFKRCLGFTPGSYVRGLTG